MPRCGQVRSSPAAPELAEHPGLELESPVLEIFRLDVHAVYELSYEQTVDEFRQSL
jgi:hypothetical protein